MSPSSSARPGRTRTTREALLDAAERLFAEQGVHSVGTRQISEAAGQGNNAAVNYHFGAKAELVRAVVRRHVVPIERHRERMLDDLDTATDVRVWAECLVRPFIDHLAELGNPTWYARFVAQVLADPVLHAVMVEESLAAGPTAPRLEDGLSRVAAALPGPIRAQRAEMARHLTIQVSVARERALTEGEPVLRPSWGETGDDLVDAIAGLMLAPVSRSL